MLSLILSYLQKPVTLKLYQVTALSLGFAGFLVTGFLYDRAVKKSDQYGEFNTFLENRLKQLNGDRSQLEVSLQEAIEKGLNTQTQIENQHEKDIKKAIVWADSSNVSEQSKEFSKRFGKIRQYPKKQ